MVEPPLEGVEGVPSRRILQGSLALIIRLPLRVLQAKVPERVSIRVPASVNGSTRDSLRLLRRFDRVP